MREDDAASDHRRTREGHERVVEIGNQDVTHLPPGDRDVAMVFQNYALYPHMTVGENLRFGLEVRKMPRKVIEQRTLEAAEMLGIRDYLGRKPGSCPAASASAWRWAEHCPSPASHS